MFRRCTLVVAIVFILTPAAWADIKTHPLISEGMVLQQGKKIPIWGTGDANNHAVVEFNGKTYRPEGSATKDGNWIVWLDNLRAGGPFPLTITGYDGDKPLNKIELKNVYVGEVWVCSGQSNMEWPVRASADPEQVAAASKNPLIRLFTVQKKVSAAPEKTLVGSWQECGPTTVPNFSAVGYFFGRDLQAALKVPVGLIHTSWGGTPAEAWTSRATLQADPGLKYMMENFDAGVANHPKALEAYKAVLEKHMEAVAKAKAEGKPAPDAPRPPVSPDKHYQSPSVLYNGMIAPVIPYGIRGAIWYQGESNAGKAYEYRHLFPTMIKNWRADWKQGEFPFLFVQLAPFTAIKKEPIESNWAELREAQLLTTRDVPHTGMAVITDVGDEKDIHPKWKEPVGARLALAARAIAYGERIDYSGPVYDGVKIDGNKAVLSFKHLGGGLVSKGGPLQGFTIAGADKKWHNAEAEIQDDKVVVWSNEVSQPVAVRFGWANYPVVNLWNKAGLPATPFRTDDWQGLTQPKK